MRALINDEGKILEATEEGLEDMEYYSGIGYREMTNEDLQALIKERNELREMLECGDCKL